jgi:hypothetical protein
MTDYLDLIVPALVLSFLLLADIVYLWEQKQ